MKQRHLLEPLPKAGKARARAQKPYRVEDDARVEHVLGVEQLLQLPHQLVRGRAPLHLHVGGHVAPSAVLTL